MDATVLFILALGALYVIIMVLIILVSAFVVPSLPPLASLFSAPSFLSKPVFAHHVAAARGAAPPFASSKLALSHSPPTVMATDFLPWRFSSSANYPSSFGSVTHPEYSYNLVAFGDLLVGKLYRSLQRRVSRAFKLLSPIFFPLTLLMCWRFESRPRS
jgi:hypothetical protein